MIDLSTCHFPLGLWVTAGLTSLLTLSGLFLTSGVDPVLPGVPDGLGLGDGLELATGTGVVGGFTGSGVFGSQAAKTAAHAANIVVKIIDLLIVFSSLVKTRTHAVRWQTPTAGLM